MEQLDLKLKLFAGIPIEAEGYGYIEPLTLREIIDYGYTKYLKALNIISLRKEDILDNLILDTDGVKKLSVLEVLIYLGDDSIHQELKKSFELFLKKEVIIDNADLCIKVNDDNDVKIINNKNYDNVVDVIKWQNYINNFEQKNSNSSSNDEKVANFNKKLMERKKKIRELKKKRGEDEENDINLLDIISSVSSKSYSINELNILDLTVCQIYYKFKRLDVIDRYDLNVKSIMAGAKNVKLNHWSSSIDE